jgi:hypothetical protein
MASGGPLVWHRAITSGYDKRSASIPSCEKTLDWYAGAALDVPYSACHSGCLAGQSNSVRSWLFHDAMLGEPFLDDWLDQVTNC